MGLIKKLEECAIKVRVMIHWVTQARMRKKMNIFITLENLINKNKKQ